MKLHPSDLPLQDPGFCAICEHSPNEGAPVVDTERNFSTPDLEYGRKYVCGPCVEAFAELLGFASPKEAAELEAKVAVAEDKVKAAATVDELKQSVDSFVEAASFVIEKDASPAPAKSAARKTAAKKA